MRKARHLLMRLSRACIAAACAAMIGCGGGGDAPGSSDLPVVRASSGNASWYGGRWVSECGSRIVSGTTVRAIRNTFQITSTAGNTATGRLTEEVFSEPLSCIGYPLSGTTLDVTLTIDPTGVAASGIVEGMADRVTLSSPGAPSQVVYVAFSGALDRFWLASQAEYRTTTPAYVKASQ